MNRRSPLVLSLACTVLGGAALAGCGSSPSSTPASGSGSGQAAPAAADLARSVDQSAAVLAGPVGKNLPSTPTLDAIRKRGTLVFAGSRSSLGFSQLDPTTKKVSGFDEGMAELLAKYLIGKPSVKMQSGSSDTREALLANHSIDVAVQTYTITPERAKLVNFAGPYYMAASGIAVKKDDTAITKPSDLAGKKVATESGAAKDALMKAVPSAKPVVFDTTSQCVTAVEQGRVDAATLNNALLLGSVATKSDMKLIGATYGTNPFGIGLPKDDPAFKKVVNQFLTTIETDGTWRKLWTDTVGKLVKTGAPTPPKPGSVTGS